jgi:CheY-like chemotaxis protein
LAILLTGSASAGVEQHAKQAGFDACLKKPVDSERLLRIIARGAGHAGA